MIGAQQHPAAAQTETPAPKTVQRPRPFPVPILRSARRPTLPISVFPSRTVWTLELNNAVTAPPAYDDTTGFFPIEGGRIAAYELTGGRRLWVSAYGSIMDPAAGGGLLFAIEPDLIVALRTGDGSIAWQLPFPDRLAVPLVWDNGWLVAATIDGAVLAFRAIDGYLIWRQDLGSPAHARPAFAGDRVYVPAEDGRVVALRVDTGALVWEHRLGGPPSDILALEDRLFVGSKDNFFYCLDTRDGTQHWRWRTGADVIGVPVVDDHNVFFLALDNVLRCLSRRSGVQQWQRPLPLRPTGSPLKAGDTLIVTGLTPTLHAYFTKDGAPAGELRMSGDLAAPPHVTFTPLTHGPLAIVVTRDIAQGALVTAVTRAVEPAILPLAPMPNLVPVAPGLPGQLSTP